MHPCPECLMTTLGYLIVYHRHHNGIRSGNARFMCIDDMPLDENGDILPIKMTKEWTLEL